MVDAKLSAVYRSSIEWPQRDAHFHHLFSFTPLHLCQRHCLRVSVIAFVSAPLQLCQRHFSCDSATAFVSAPLLLCQRHFICVSATAFVSATLHLFPCHIICASGTSLYEGHTLFDSTFRKLHILCISTSFSMTQPRALRLYHYLFVRGSEPLSF